ncbi:MAG: hypothetical protein ACMUJI_14600 [Erythrobacter sp.]|uniref:hypothetical protein n=1 Tax=Erythrobacter sp. TaxID=1042 RepID=UPI003A89CA78
MQVHPAIAALRADPPLQRRATAEVEAALFLWDQHEHVSAVHRDLLRYAAGEDLTRLPMLASLMEELAVAQDYVGSFISAIIPALREHPLAEVPLRQSRSPGYSRLLLWQEAGVTLSLSTYEPVSSNTEPETAQFADCERNELLVSGEASGWHFSVCDQGRVKADRKSWRQGDSICCHARRESRQFVGVQRSVTLLQLIRTPKRPAPTLVYNLADSALVQQSSGDKRASQQVMALGVLGALGNSAAIAPMIAFASDPSHDTTARWEAVRQVLALDARAGLNLLSELSSCQADPLAQPARSLHRDLLQRQPELAQANVEPA